MKKIVILFTLVLSVLLIKPNLVKANNTEEINIVNFNLFNEKNVQVKELYQNKKYSLSIDLEIQKPINQFFAEGEVYSFPILNHNSKSGDFVIQETSYANLNIMINNELTHIGEWKMHSNPRSIEIVLNKNVTSLNKISNIKLETGLMIRNNVFIDKDFNGVVSILNFTDNYTFKGNPLIIYRNDFIYKYNGNVTNTSVRWGLNFNSNAAHELYAHNSSYKPLMNVYIEDNLGDGTMTDLIIRGLMYAPLSLDNSKPGNFNYGVDIGGFLKKVEPDYDVHTTYLKFKASLNRYEWGEYKDTSGNHFVLFMGDLDDSQIKYDYSSSNHFELFADRIIGAGYYDSDQKGQVIQILEDAYGSDSIVKGSMIHYLLQIFVEYPDELEKQTIVNTAYINGTDFTYNSTDNAILQEMDSSGDSEIGTITLTKIDSKGLPISGAVFVIEVYNELNDLWETVSNQTAQTTDEFGLITFENLVVGKYRLTEIIAAEGYDIGTIEYYKDGVIVSNEFYIVKDTNEIVALKAINYKDAVISAVKESTVNNDENLIDNDTIVSYVITLSNSGEVEKLINIADPLTDIREYILDPSTNNVTIDSSINGLKNYTVAELMKGIDMIILPGETIIITFDIVAKSDITSLKIESLTNTAYLTIEDDVRELVVTNKVVEPGKDPVDTGIQTANTKQYMFILFIGMFLYLSLYKKRKKIYN